MIDTNHSFYRPANGAAIIYPSTVSCIETVLSDVAEHEDIGYIRVDGFSGTSAEATALATNIQQRIREQDHAGIRGWIVDLRHNRGGNMWPMIAGLGPLLGNGIAGYFINPDEVQTSWGYEDGVAFISSPIVTVQPYYELLVPAQKIAVLSSRQVASSGEAALIALKGLAHSRVFGSDSCGLSTSNSSFQLSDGAQLLLTTATMADRHLNAYGGQVAVDEHVAQQNVLAQAMAWILAP
ncbi:hypothetical protein WG68_13555 [Arsukibacterium ikkense]|uniref:Tail specific protease domain-containing protein n=1 Tax=Arsukibacterium ikkense TaxID=336831 RepID=A0A0M2V257_9GAMM|nr:hypothetical protein WG68_13555 [Arsukibacterium ikkense]